MAKGMGEIYLKTMKKHFQKRANWKPGRAMNLGDYGILTKKGYFSKMGNISKDFGIKFEIELDDSADDVEQFCSKKGFEIVWRARGDVTPGGFKFLKAGVSINFAKKEAVFVDANGCRYDQITNIPALGEKIVEKYNKGSGKWKRRYILVTEVERAEGATIVVTRGDGASIDIEAKVDGPIESISDTGLGLKMARTSNIGYRIVARKGLKLMMETMRIHDSLFDKTKIKSLGRKRGRKKKREISLELWLD